MNALVEVIRLADADAVASGAAKAVVETLSGLLSKQPTAHLVVTGGSVGILTLAKLSQLGASLDWSRVHVWWGDERFVARDSADRNVNQAKDAWLVNAPIPGQNIHAFPASDQGLSLNDAANAFGAELRENATTGKEFPDFDILLLGMGPDGHVASLFPGVNHLGGALIVAESDSPKPPPQRLSFSYDLINSATEVWFTVAGADKAAAVSQVFNNHESKLPAAQVSGRNKTVWFLDEAAATNI